MPIVVGFPEFQEQVIERFPLFFTALAPLQEALNDLTGEGHESISSVNHLILNLGVLAGASMMEVVLLAVNGFGPGAPKAARSLLETSVTAEYLRLHPEHFEDFIEWFHVEKFKEVEFLQTYLPDSYARLEQAHVQSVRAEMDRVKDRFGQRRSWCRHNLAERARQTDCLESYRTLNPIASSFVHVTPYGLHRRFEGEDTFRIDVPPSRSWIDQALVSGHALTLGMIHTLVRIFRPEIESTLYASLLHDYVNAWLRV